MRSVGFPSPSEEINSIAFGLDGSVWYSGFSPEVFAYAPSTGGVIGHLVPGSPPQAFKVGENSLTGSIVQGGGSMWFAARGGVGRIDTGGAYQLGSTAPYQPGTATSPDDLVYGPDGALWFIDETHAALVRVAIDGALFPPSVPPGPTVRPTAPAVRVAAKPQSLKQVLKRKAILVTCTIAGAGNCMAALSIGVKDARALDLKVGKKAKTAALGQASKTFKNAGTAQLAVKLRSKILGALSHLRKPLKVTVLATSSTPGANDSKATTTLKLTR